MTTTTIEQPSKCATCGQDVPAPADGVWRFAMGGKIHASLAVAQVRAEDLNRNKKFGSTHEAMGALDPDGQARIATRRRQAQRA